MKILKFLESRIFNYKIYFAVGFLLFLLGIIFVIFLRINYLSPLINQLRGHAVSEFGLRVINERYLFPVKLIFILSGLILISFGFFFKFKNFQDKITFSIRKTWQRLLGLKLWQILLILLVFNLVIRGTLMFFAPEAKIEADGAYYVGLARSISTGEGYVAHTVNKLSIVPEQLPYPVFDVPPLYSLLLLVSFKIFGYGFLSNILPNVILGILLPILVFLFAFQITQEKRIALLSGILMSVNSVLTGSMSFQVLREPLFICLILLCFIFLFKENNFKNLTLTGLFLGLAFLTRMEAIILILPIIFIALFKKFGLKKTSVRFLFVVFIFSLVVSPWLIRNYKLSGEPFGFGIKFVTLYSLDVHQGYEISRSSITTPEISLKYIEKNFFKITKSIISKAFDSVRYSLLLTGSIFIILFFFIGLGQAVKKRDKYWLMILFIVITYVFYPFFTSQTRHFYLLIPFFLIFSSIGIFKTIDFLNSRKGLFKVDSAILKNTLVYSLTLICLFVFFYGVVSAMRVPIFRMPGANEGKIVVEQLGKDTEWINTVMYSSNPDILSYWMPGKNIIPFPEKDLDNLDYLIKKYNVNLVILIKDMNDTTYQKIQSLGAKLVNSSQPDPNIELKIYKL